MSDENVQSQPPSPSTTPPSIESTPDDRTMALVCHIGGAVGSFLIPLIIWLIKKDQSKFVDDQGKEVINFHITFAAAAHRLRPHLLFHLWCAQRSCLGARPGLWHYGSSRRPEGGSLSLPVRTSADQVTSTNRPTQDSGTAHAYRQRNSPAVHRLLRARSTATPSCRRRSVVPLDDPTLLFTNAGMNQFKDVFLGTGTRPYKRAVNTQKCIRAGGKHNDLDDVGKDTYHHTFFEMLGNWSFGDYFKKEAIAWAWELLTEVWGLDKTRLHATVFEGDADEGVPRDDEAAELWQTDDRHRPDAHPSGQQEGQLLGDGRHRPVRPVHRDPLRPHAGQDRRPSSSTRARRTSSRSGTSSSSSSIATRTGSLTPLPAKHVDTGMGFERVTAVLQGKTSNYDTDVFTPIFAAIQQDDRRGRRTPASSTI